MRDAMVVGEELTAPERLGDPEIYRSGVVVGPIICRKILRQNQSGTTMVLAQICTNQA